jgi:serine/threonine protein kinase
MSYPEELPANTLVDRRYRIQKTLGQGGFGRTYLVMDERRFNEPCVLKEFVPKGSEEYVVEKSRELFQREAAVLHHLSHPQIPGFLAQFEEEDRLFLVQDYVNGRTYQDLLEERQRKGKTFNEIEVSQLLKNLLPVLDYIHSRNIIHRDISPDNIMIVTERDRIMLIDFGVVNHQELRHYTSKIGHSVPGTTVGKVGFSPVEQIQQGKCYPNSDLYALAVTALVLLSGKHPDELFDSYELKWQWRDYVSVSPKLGQILDKMLATVPQQRYQSSLEVLTELTDLSDDSATTCLDSQQNSKRSPEPTFVAPQSRANTHRAPEPTFVTPQSQANTHRAPKPTFVTPQSQPNSMGKDAATVVTANNLDSISSRPGAKTIISNSEVNNAFRDRNKINKPKSLTNYFALVSLAALLIGAVFIGMRSPDIAGICDILDNCSNNTKAEKTGNRPVESEIQTKPTPKPETEKTDIFDNPDPSPPSSKELLW